jgi:uncharacterized protein DUF6883
MSRPAEHKVVAASGSLRDPLELPASIDRCIDLQASSSSSMGAKLRISSRSMRLPKGERADLGTKLEDYVLNTLHRHGRHKARVFDAVLGITSANADVLGRALLDAAATSDQAEARGDTGFGDVYSLRFPVRTGKGSATILSVWIGRSGEDFPRLATCYIV